MRRNVNVKTSVATKLLVVAVTILATLYLQTGAFAQSSEIKAVTDVLTEEAKAVERGDLAALDKLWANDETVTVFESGHANYGWNDYRNSHLAPELKEFKNTKYSFSDLKVKIDGKTAWATFKYSLAAEIGDRKIESGGLGTAVLEKRNGQWRIVHWHSSAPRRQPAPRPSEPAPKN